MAKKDKQIWLVVLVVLGALIALQVVGVVRYNRQASAFANDSIVGQGAPVLLEIGSATCGACRRMLPILTELAEEQAENFRVALVSLDKKPDASQTYNVRAIPTQIFYDGSGKELYRHTGVLSKQEILDRWRQFGVGGL